MATIEHLQGENKEDVVKRAVEAFMAMEPGVLLAQQVCIHGARDALSQLLARGCTPENLLLMLNDVMLTLGMVHGVAAKRGIKLPEFPIQGGIKPGEKVH